MNYGDEKLFHPLLHKAFFFNLQMYILRCESQP